MEQPSAGTPAAPPAPSATSKPSHAERENQPKAALQSLVTRLQTIAGKVHNALDARNMDREVGEVAAGLLDWRDRHGKTPEPDKASAAPAPAAPFRAGVTQGT